MLISFGGLLVVVVFRVFWWFAICWCNFLWFLFVDLMPLGFSVGSPYYCCLMCSALAFALAFWFGVDAFCCFVFWVRWWFLCVVFGRVR